jgi:hypothetical protein
LVVVAAEALDILAVAELEAYYTTQHFQWFQVHHIL